jgi:type II secretory pathway pseudopilin PulG
MRRQAGFVLLVELMISTVIFAILAAMTVPFVLTLQQVANEQVAHRRVMQVSDAEAALAICAMTNGCVPNVAVQAIVPAVGSIITQGYTYVMAVNGSNWTFTATPIYQGWAYYIDDSSVLHCDRMSATKTSPICN